MSLPRRPVSRRSPPARPSACPAVPAAPAGRACPWGAGRCRRACDSVRVHGDGAVGPDRRGGVGFGPVDLLHPVGDGLHQYMPCPVGDVLQDIGPRAVEHRTPRGLPLRDAAGEQSDEDGPGGGALRGADGAPQQGGARSARSRAGHVDPRGVATELTVCGRGQTDGTLEPGAERADALVSDDIADIRDVQLGADEEPFGLLEPERGKKSSG